MHSLILDLKFAIWVLLRNSTMTFVVRTHGDPAAATTDVPNGGWSDRPWTHRLRRRYDG